jgi:branched-chain amino acid transport system permease protein
VYVGGIGTLWGPVLGTALYVIVREQLALTVGQAHQVIFGALFVLVVLAFPGGLVDAWARLRPALERRRRRRGSTARRSW